MFVRTKRVLNEFELNRVVDNNIGFTSRNIL